MVAVHLLIVLVDPLGAYTNELNWQAITAQTNHHETGVSMREGTHELIGYRVTMLADGLRYVPDSIESDCTIAFIGDSFTWGYAVNDDETFANRIADALGVHVINAGRNGYNAEQVLASRNYYDADLYVYLHIWNDHQPPVRVHQHQAESALMSYYHTLRNNGIGMFGTIAERQAIGADYINAMDVLTGDSDVMVFVFEDVLFSGLGTYASERWSNVIMLPDSVYINDMVSYSDPHPNAIGHQQIADAMLADVLSFIEDTC